MNIIGIEVAAVLAGFTTWLVGAMALAVLIGRTARLRESDN